MKPNKKLFRTNKNYNYDHKIGAYQRRRSAGSYVFMASFIVVMGGAVWAGHWALNSKVVNARQDGAAESSIKQATPTQQKFGEQTYSVREDEALTKTIKQKIDTMPKSTRWSVSVRDIRTGRMANVNSDEVMPAASVYKLFLLAPLEKKLPANNWSVYLGRSSVQDCVIAMLKMSDNDCAEAVMRYANPAKIDQINEELGFKNTKLNTMNNTPVTTARDAAEMMYRLQTSKILSDKGRRTVFDALYEQKYREGIPSGCNNECLVANKTGDVDNIKNDVGVVSYGGNQYIVAIMSQNTSWKQIAELSGFINSEIIP